MAWHLFSRSRWKTQSLDPGEGVKDTYVSGGIFIWAWAVIHKQKNPRIPRSFLVPTSLPSILLSTPNMKLLTARIPKSWRQLDKLGSALKVQEDDKEFVGNGFLMLANVSRRRPWQRMVLKPEQSPSCLDKLVLLPASSCFIFSSSLNKLPEDLWQLPTHPEQTGGEVESRRQTLEVKSEKWSFLETPEEKCDSEKFPLQLLQVLPGYSRLLLVKPGPISGLISLTCMNLGRHKAGSLQQILQPFASTVTQFAT